MSAYGNLVVRCALKIAQAEKAFGGPVLPGGPERLAYAEAVLSEVRRTLESVTKRMEASASCFFDGETACTRNAYLEMLRASPLTPP